MRLLAGALATLTLRRFGISEAMGNFTEPDITFFVIYRL